MTHTKVYSRVASKSSDSSSRRASHTKSKLFNLLFHTDPEISIHRQAKRGRCMSLTE